SRCPSIMHAPLSYDAFVCPRGAEPGRRRARRPHRWAPLRYACQVERPPWGGLDGRSRRWMEVAESASLMHPRLPPVQWRHDGDLPLSEPPSPLLPLPPAALATDATF